MLLFPTGSFFIGYTISAALTGLVFGLFLHNAKTRKQFLLRLIISNLMVLVFISLGLTTFWLAITMKKAFWALIPVRIVSAAIRFPIETGTIFALTAVLDKPVKKYLYDEDTPAGDNSDTAQHDSDAGNDAAAGGKPGEKG
jgi:ECF transporter S component (folate family)